MADANSAYTLADARAPEAARRFLPDDDRAAAGARRHHRPRRAAGAARHADLPGRVHSLGAPRRAGHPPGRLRHHQHQTGPRGRVSAKRGACTTWRRRRASRSGAAACWNPASAARTTSRSRRCRTSCCRATSRPAKRYWARDIVCPPVEITPRGTIVVRDEPGFGYEIDQRLPAAGSLFGRRPSIDVCRAAAPELELPPCLDRRRW